ncbi:hypothetical protein NE562_13285 [Butyricicoccus faecihominis]|uniref:hypothetical protein n=1 Tax=Butyricicoccus faecihominis TaxID=1712515 RepID=UPI00247AAE41|nr:hypothetical protein [Butyricicoccus faecihominis]MCQ5130640.1 hypothetical protein [Butyricicoccus faecihominis]
MATTTDNYGLIKPGIDDFYDIGVQNENWDAVDTALEEHAQQLSPSGEKENPADSDSLILTDSTANGIKKRLSWTGVKTALGKVFAGLQHTHSMEEVDALGAALANKADTFITMNIVPASIEEIWALGPGQYSWVQSEPLTWQPSDTPTGALRVLITVSASETAAGTRTVDLRYVDGAIDRVSYMGEDTGTGIRWVKIATATPPQVYDLPLAAGVKKYSEDWKNCYSKAQDGLVLVHLAAETISGEPPARFATIATLPVGYRPAKNVAGLPIQGGTGVNGFINVRGDGVIEAAFCTGHQMFGFITFYAA